MARNTFTAEQRLKIVRKTIGLLKQDRTYTEIGTALGINPSTLCNWTNDYQKGTMHRFVQDKTTVGKIKARTSNSTYTVEEIKHMPREVLEQAFPLDASKRNVRGYTNEQRSSVYDQYLSLRAQGLGHYRASFVAGAAPVSIRYWEQQGFVSQTESAPKPAEAETQPEADTCATHEAHIELEQRVSDLEVKSDLIATAAYDRWVQHDKRIERLESAAPYTPDARLSALEQHLAALGSSQRRTIEDFGARIGTLESVQDARAVPALAEAHTDLAARLGMLEQEEKISHQSLEDARKRISALERADPSTPFAFIVITVVLVIVNLVLIYIHLS